MLDLKQIKNSWIQCVSRVAYKCQTKRHPHASEGQREREQRFSRLCFRCGRWRSWSGLLSGLEKPLWTAETRGCHNTMNNSELYRCIYVLKTRFVSHRLYSFSTRHPGKEDFSMTARVFWSNITWMQDVGSDYGSDNDGRDLSPYFKALICLSGLQTIILYVLFM